MTAGREDEMRKNREEMVASQISRRGVKNERVLEAMRTVPREIFIRKEDERLAFCDGPLSIGCGQTISQPYIVAYMTAILDIGPNDRVLEVGTGSGYQTAVLAELAREVCTIECVEELSLAAQEKLKALQYENIAFRVGDGSLGWPEEAPFDAIMVTAAPESMPETLALQLTVEGRMIIPVGRFEQYLYKIVRVDDGIDKKKLIGVRFVPMVGKIQENM